LLAALMLAASAYAQGGKPIGAVGATPPEQRGSGAAPGTAWHVSIVKQIQQERRYPADALSRRLDGTTKIDFAIDRAGRLTDIGIAESSGHPELDQAAVDALARAQPFPPPPAELPGETFRFTVPFVFVPRRGEPSSPPPSPR
jgi:periplasmic protein TonB